MTELITNPHFKVEQDVNSPVDVIYYRMADYSPMLEIRQDGQVIIIDNVEQLKKLVRLVCKHEKEVKEYFKD